MVRCIAGAVDPAAREVNGRTPLHAAAGFSESPAVIAALLDAGADLQARDVNGRTPLHVAAASDDLCFFTVTGCFSDGVNPLTEPRRVWRRLQLSC